MGFLQIKDLKIHFPIKAGILKRTVGYVKAVDGLNISLEEGKTYGLVGESGSGKTTTGRGIIGLNDITSGQIFINNKEVTKRNIKEFRRDVQMVFQDPYSSLNPKKRIIDIVAEPFRNFEKMTKQEEQRAVQELLERVGISPDSIFKYPHEFSGGQRQRIGIARAIALKPKLIIADEPVSALDVSVQAQVLNFMQDIQKDLNLTYFFISHDLGIIRHICDHIGIMYKGRFVEEGTPDDIFTNPQHIYTRRLISSIPDIDPTKRGDIQLIRKKINQEYETNTQDYFDNEGLAYPLKSLSPTHRVAMPEGS
ncbi:MULTISPECIES: ABC transporter ATP-binding protein [Shouchella]|uniref:Oligopeptide transport ATP-binding protein OppF n=3 Tax=Bacillaceae TaxID=186817 RepID=A0A060M507_9BACI|nr:MULTISPECIES: ATP-binding cassette domain-containing protein [Bacillaceae]AIC95628.1 Oligopeptide transport ATP-binding protein OppF [Shouchella lehensis G1]KQL55745.1 peptide ABC transporter substrate-binding protein [Alkalicoccobacillus plakortidis]MBG9783673.1 peptide ABC transporter substrate-binding protein [Shouchella lehensis]TES51379.1 ABC transporter ATP-binding protein [Shouchella lehensis]